MARRGSFGTSLSPFGGGNLGNLGQYSIGDNLKDLAAYSTEVAWGNGTITDQQYAASLAQQAAAADPGTQAAISAQNKLEDVQYRIGRSQADAVGLDALIAYDQQSLAGMNPGNLRYRDIASTLGSELAQRRSRDYGKLVDAYNAGDTSTESLLAWVQSTIASLPADAPDKDNWDSVNSSLTDRIVSEKDAKVYQDYQDRKMKPADFLAYLTGRRDAYDPSSPKWDEANRRLEDAQKNVKDAAQSVIDNRVADQYTNGKISDRTYLVWLKKRVDALPADDPTLAAWHQRLTVAAHSLAEDKLRTDVSLAKTQAAQDTAKKHLSDFYKAYATTLNPGSAEYRTTMVSIHALTPTKAPGGGGGGGGSAKGTGKAGTLGVAEGKIINPKTDLSTLVHLITPNATAPKKVQTVIVDALRLNLSRAQDGLHDKVWLFQDPRTLGDVVAKQNPDGTPVLDKKGKPVMVRGTVYMPASSDAIAAMQLATAAYSYQLADIAASKGKQAEYLTALWHGQTAEDSARTTAATFTRANLTKQLDTIQRGIDLVTSMGDAATAVNLLKMSANLIDRAVSDGSLDQTQRDAIVKRQDKILANPLFPAGETDLNGNPVPGKQVGGFVDVLNSPRDAKGNLIAGAAVMVPGVHYMLKTGSTGAPDWGWVYDDGAPGTWEVNRNGAPAHITVQTGNKGQVVTGEVEVSSAPIQPLITFTTTDGKIRTIAYVGGAQYITYKDGDGNRVDGYSIDGGKSWVQTTDGIPPMLQVNGTMTYSETTSQSGVTSAEIKDAQGHTVFASSDIRDPSAWQTDIQNAGASGDISWWGQTGAIVIHGVGGVGYPGQDFRIVNVDVGSDGKPSLNFIPAQILTDQANADRYTKIAQMGAAKQHADRVAELQSIFGKPAQSDPTGAWYGDRSIGAPGNARISALANVPGIDTAISALKIFGAYGKPPELHDSRSPASAFVEGAKASASLGLRNASPSFSPSILSIGASPPPLASPPASLPPAYVPTLTPVELHDSRLPSVTKPTLKPVNTAPPLPPANLKNAAPSFSPRAPTLTPVVNASTGFVTGSKPLPPPKATTLPKRKML